MAHSVKRTVKMLVGRANDYKDVLFDDTQSVEDTTAVSEYSEGTAKISASGSFAVPFGGVTTAKYVYIQTDVQVKATYNGGSDKITIGNSSAAGNSFVSFVEGSFTSLSLVNSTAAVANVTYFVGGA